MKNPKLFKKTKGIITSALKSKGLEFGLTDKCALGVILTAAANGNYEKEQFVKYWGILLRETNVEGVRTKKNPFPLSKERVDEINKNVSSLIKKSGYSTDELERIEFAFEKIYNENKARIENDEKFEDELIPVAVESVLKELELIHQN